MWKLIALSVRNMEVLNILCTSCGKTFPNKTKLTKHTAGVHTHTKTECKECGKMMKSMKHLENHLSSHRTVTCKKCNKSIQKKSRTSHICGVLFQYPIDPLHAIYHGPVNDILSRLEEKYPEEMKEFYSSNSLSKKGQGIGGTFNGPSIKDILQEIKLNQLASLLLARRTRLCRMRLLSSRFMKAWFLIFFQSLSHSS